MDIELFIAFPYCTFSAYRFVVISSPFKSICQTTARIILATHTHDPANPQLKVLQGSPIIFKMKFKVLNKTLHHLTIDSHFLFHLHYIILNSSSSSCILLLLECTPGCTHSLKYLSLPFSSSFFYLIDSY